MDIATLRPRRLWQTPAGPGWGPLPELLLTLTAVTGLVAFGAGTADAIAAVLAVAMGLQNAAAAAQAARRPGDWRARPAASAR